ncbi:MAG: hypothetical protein AB7O67_16085 [Vicinamibacterales bacterium]
MSLPWLLAVVILLAWAPATASGASGERRFTDVRALQQLVDDLRAQLGLMQAVTVTIVPENRMLASMRWQDERERGFELAAERRMLGDLDDEEVRAVVAHELGHAWIFTHHPYLQTEALANRIALRLVSRESLERVYEKVWERTGKKGDMFPRR